MAYKEDEYLMLSGIQHFKFCRRQWALIHIEQQWSENVHTVDKKLDIENPIIRINTAFKGCSSLEKISVLPRIYHN